MKKNTVAILVIALVIGGIIYYKKVYKKSVPAKTEEVKADSTLVGSASLPLTNDSLPQFVKQVTDTNPNSAASKKLVDTLKNNTQRKTTSVRVSEVIAPKSVLTTTKEQTSVSETVIPKETRR